MSMVNSELLSEKENYIMQLLGAAWNEYVLLPELHPMERVEMCGLIHRCQEKVMSRPVLRDLCKKAGT